MSSLLPAGLPQAGSWARTLAQPSLRSASPRQSDSRLPRARAPRRFSAHAGIGDLALTANSLQSRNTSLGVALGEGRKLSDVLAERKEVTEGAFSVEAIVELAHRLGVAMPLSGAIDQVLNHGADLDASMARWMEVTRV